MTSSEYGYSDNEATDYGYEEVTPDEEDFGYGNAAPDTDEYGYGDATPDDYGYEDTNPSPKPAAVIERPKRRCSVTKYNLDQDSALTAADRIREMRSENSGPSSPPPVESEIEEKSAVLESSATKTKDPSTSKNDLKKKGVMSRMRKRLSLAF